MTHQELANGFCKFVYDFTNEGNNIKFINKTDEMFYRVCFQKLYYALYHKMLQHDPNLSESNAPGKHETIMQKIKNTHDSQLIQIYAKMKSLRLWADYEPSDIPNTTSNIQYYQYQVYKILKRKVINI